MLDVLGLFLLSSNRQGRWYYARPPPEQNHPWNSFILRRKKGAECKLLVIKSSGMDWESLRFGLGIEANRGGDIILGPYQNWTTPGIISGGYGDCVQEGKN